MGTQKSDLRLSTISSEVYYHCVLEQKLPIEKINLTYSYFKSEIDAIIDASIIDGEIENIDIAKSIAISLFYDEFLSENTHDRKVEIRDDKIFKGRVKENKITYKFFHNYYYASHLNCKESQYYIANTYEYGLYVKRDYLKMIEWYERSANNGYIPAMIELYSIYSRTLNSEHKNTSLFWLIKAANLDDCFSLLEVRRAIAIRLNTKKIGNKGKELYGEHHIIEFTSYCLIRSGFADFDLFCTKSEIDNIKWTKEDFKKYFEVYYPSGKLNLEMEFKHLRMRTNLFDL